MVIRSILQGTPISKRGVRVAPGRTAAGGDLDPCRGDDGVEPTQRGHFGPHRMGATARRDRDRHSPAVENFAVRIGSVEVEETAGEGLPVDAVTRLRRKEPVVFDPVFRRAVIAAMRTRHAGPSPGSLPACRRHRPSVISRTGCPEWSRTVAAFPGSGAEVEPTSMFRSGCRRPPT